MAIGDFHIANDQPTLAALLGELGERPSDAELDEAHADAIAAGCRGSAIDPPFATLVKRVEAMNGTGALSERLNAALTTLEQEIEWLAEGFDEWNQHVADYGFSTPESMVAICVVASVLPELRQARDTFATERDLAQWLLQNPVSFRVLKRALSWATCAIGADHRRPIAEREEKSSATQRRFLWLVFRSIADEVRDIEKDNGDKW
jgi:hypothetical protein